jgi:hypothetical protein
VRLIASRGRRVWPRPRVSDVMDQLANWLAFVTQPTALRGRRPAAPLGGMRAPRVWISLIDGTLGRERCSRCARGSSASIRALRDPQAVGLPGPLLARAHLVGLSAPEHGFRSHPRQYRVRSSAHAGA